MKKIIIALFAAVIMSFAGAQSAQAEAYTRSDIQTLVDVMDAMCPYQLDGGMSIRCVTLSNTAITCVIDTDFDRETVTELQSSEGELKELFLENFRQVSSLDELMKGCADQRINFVIMLYSSDYKASVSVVISWREMQPSSSPVRASSASSRGSSSAGQSLSSQVEAFNALCPLDFGEGVSIANVRLTDENLIMTMDTEFEDDVIEIMDMMSDTLAETMMEEFKKEGDMKGFMDLCKKEKVNLMIKMYSKGRGAKAYIVLEWYNM